MICRDQLLAVGAGGTRRRAKHELHNDGLVIEADATSAQYMTPLLTNAHV
jgi:hypothetical protein